MTSDNNHQNTQKQSISHIYGAMGNSMTEKGTVDRAIEIEERIEEIDRLLSYYEHLIFEAGFFGEYPHWIDDKYDDLESELSDLQKEYKG